MVVGLADGAVVRLATLADIDGLLALETEFPSDRLTRRSFARHLRSPNTWLAVAVQGDQPVGYAMVLFRKDRGWGRLYSIVVDPAARGQGFATRLMEAAETEVIGRHLAEIRLEVRADNPSALRMYERRGYEKTTILTAYYADGTDGFRLRRRW